MLSIVKFVIRTFVLHVSIAKPLGEGGKLQLTSDMTELEFSLNAFMADGQSHRGGNLESVGDDYRILRGMRSVVIRRVFSLTITHRPLLFLENAQLGSPSYTSGLPPLIVLHHILVRSPIPLPHNLHGWQEAEYVRWVEEHTEEEAWSLIESGLSHWEKVSEEENDSRKAVEYIQLARIVLTSAISAT
jgi:conserved oligomeric Golgi complex subunit 5